MCQAGGESVTKLLACVFIEFITPPQNVTVIILLCVQPQQTSLLIFNLTQLYTSYGLATCFGFCMDRGHGIV